MVGTLITVHVTKILGWKDRMGTSKDEGEGVRFTTMAQTIDVATKVNMR